MDIVFEILKWLTKIMSAVPDVIWSGVIASILTLSGVLLSNSSNTKRLKIQLSHDAEQKDRDRKAAIRKEVYLDVAKAAVNATSYLSGIANVPITEINAGLRDFYVASAKLMLVADMKTTLVVNKMSNSISGLVLEVMPELIKIADYEVNIQTFTALHSDSELEIRRILAAQRTFNESPAPKDPQVFRTLQSTFEFQQGQSKSMNETRQKFGVLKATAQIAFGQNLLPKLLELNDMQIEVLISIREEIGLTSDIEIFMQQQKTFREEQALKLQKLIGFLNEKIDTLKSGEIAV